MSEKIKRYISLLLTVLMTLSLVSCGTADDKDDYVEGKSAGKELGQTAAADDVFTLNCNKSYSMNPLIATNTNNQLVCNLVYENMLEVSNSFELIPNIITDWETTDGGQRWVFTIDTSHVFHDGQRLTATDVSYSMQCAVNSDRFKGRFTYVAGSSATDEKTVVVNLTKKNMQFPMLLTVPVIQYGTFNNTYPGGSGPYAYASDYNSLNAFDKYPNSATLPLKTIYLKEYGGVDETISAFEDSLIDVVMNDPSANTNLGYGNANEIRGFNTTNMHYIGFNSSSRDFAYEFLRFAMNYAFDRDYLVNQFSGYATAAALPINPASSLYNENYAKQFKYDLKQVQSMLSNAGMKDYDEDGYLEIKNGETLIEIDISFLVFSGSTVKVNMAQKFAEDMKSIGIKVTVNKQDWDNYRALLTAGNYDMYYAEVRLNSDFDPSKLLMTSASLNYGAVSDSSLETLISDYLAADDENRQTACDNMCAYIINKAYIVPLCFEKHQMITHRGVIEGIKANENNPFYNISNWTVTFENVDKTLTENKKS